MYLLHQIKTIVVNFVRDTKVCVKFKPLRRCPENTDNLSLFQMFIYSQTFFNLRFLFNI